MWKSNPRKETNTSLRRFCLRSRLGFFSGRSTRSGKNGRRTTAEYNRTQEADFRHRLDVWFWILVGVIIGAIMSMWSFNGPLNSPVGDYTSLPRRMLRLSHIAFIALAVINILYGYEIDKIKLKDKIKKLGSNFIMYGSILMPLILLGAVFFENLKYLTVIPSFLIIIALVSIVLGMMKN